MRRALWELIAWLLVIPAARFAIVMGIALTAADGLVVVAANRLVRKRAL